MRYLVTDPRQAIEYHGKPLSGWLRPELPVVFGSESARWVSDDVREKDRYRGNCPGSHWGEAVAALPDPCHIGVLMPRARKAHQPRAPSKIMNEPVTQRKIPAVSNVSQPVNAPVTIKTTPPMPTTMPPFKRAFRPRWSMLHVSFLLGGVPGLPAPVQKL